MLFASALFKAAGLCPSPAVGSLSPRQLRARISRQGWSARPVAGPKGTAWETAAAGSSTTTRRPSLTFRASCSSTPTSLRDRTSYTAASTRTHKHTRTRTHTTLPIPPTNANLRTHENVPARSHARSSTLAGVGYEQTHWLRTLRLETGRRHHARRLPRHLAAWPSAARRATLALPRIAAAVCVRASAAYLHGVCASGQRSLAVAIYAPLPGEVYSSSTLKRTRGLSRAAQPPAHSLTGALAAD